MTRLNHALTAIAAASVFALAACAGPTVTVRQQCQPINKYDTRCGQMASEAARPASPDPITLTRPHRLTYVIDPDTYTDWLAIVQGVTTTSNETHNLGTVNGEAKLPFRRDVNAPAGLLPNLTYSPGGICHVLLDGQDVTVQLDSPGASVYVCGAGREP